MKVIATRDGFYGKLRAAGDQFEVTDPAHVSKKWMAEVGSKKYEDFIEAHERRGGQVKEIDKITGERLISGGVAEQLAIALEENRELKAQIAELQATINVLEDERGKSKTPPPTPAPAEKTEDADKEQADGEGATRVRRREPKK